MHIEVQHPLIAHKLAHLRRTRTDHREFRDLTRELSQLIAYEAFRKLPLKTVAVETPLATVDGSQVAVDVVIVPVLRAGIGMLEGILSLVPEARVGFVGLYRDPETKQPVEYYQKLPPANAEDYYLVIDPMLATGGSTAATLDLLCEHGAKNIAVACIVAAPEGLAVVAERHPEIPIYAASVDSHLDQHKYIIPGLGDAGDRLFGTA